VQALAHARAGSAPPKTCARGWRALEILVDHDLEALTPGGFHRLVAVMKGDGAA
jgi:hypothetical protein